MTIFGVVTVALWTLMAVYSQQISARLLCLLMIIGTLIWGTGSL